MNFCVLNLLSKAKLVSVILLFICGFNFLSCTSVVQPSTNNFTPWDTSFSISGMKFPNDSIYSRAVISSASNWRLYQFIQKCKTQDSIRVGFIGGSITWGAWSSSPALRYSSLFCASLQKCFPNLKQVFEINAGVSATPSRFGCSRLNADLLSLAPDLIVIEFAVNDYNQGDSAFLHSTFEGLVRQCLAIRNDIPVILLFTSKGDGTNVQQLQSDIGNYYSLPMISYRDAIWPLIVSKQVPPETFFYDDPHPNDNGHRVCAYLLYSYLKKEIQNSEGLPISFPSYRYSDLYQYAGLITAGDSTVNVTGYGWKSITKEKNRIGFASSINDSTIITFKTKRKEMTLGIHMQPTDTSSIHIIVDNGLLDTTVSNNYVFEYTKFLHIYTSPSDTTHVIQVKNLGRSIFTIGYVLYSGKI